MDPPLALSAVPLALAAAALGLVVLALRALWLEPASLHNRTYTIALPGWPSGHGPLRIALVADLHVGSPHNGLDRLERVVRVVRAARPDLVLLGGDFVVTGVAGGRAVPPEAIARRLAKLAAPLGVHAVLGNHDWWYDGARVAAALEGAGVRVHRNGAVKLGCAGRRFWLAGVGDFWEGAPDIARALSRVADDDPVILLTHNPDLFPAVPERVALTLAGHTHGGQVSLPGVGRPVVPSLYGSRYAFGHITEGGRHLFVTPGVGTSIVGIRFRVPPEVSVLDVVPARPRAVALRRGRSSARGQRPRPPSPASSWTA